MSCSVQEHPPIPKKAQGRRYARECKRRSSKIQGSPGPGSFPQLTHSFSPGTSFAFEALEDQRDQDGMRSIPRTALLPTALCSEPDNFTSKEPSVRACTKTENRELSFSQFGFADYTGHPEAMLPQGDTYLDFASLDFESELFNQSVMDSTAGGSWPWDLCDNLRDADPFRPSPVEPSQGYHNMTLYGRDKSCRK